MSGDSACGTCPLCLQICEPWNFVTFLGVTMVMHVIVCDVCVTQDPSVCTSLEKLYPA